MHMHAPGYYCVLIVCFALLTTVGESVAQRTTNHPTIGRLYRDDPRFDKLVSPNAKVEVLATGFEWSEGPVWVKKGGYLLCSDIPRNSIMKWTEKDGLTLFMKPSGYT